MAIDCETCQPALLDLIHGELDPALAVEARQHIEGCASCRADMRRLGSGLELARQLPLLEAPPALTERVLAVAEGHAERVRQARSPAHKSWSQRWLDFLGQLVATPQVGMATISLLVVAVGLWSVPRLTREPEAAGVTVVNPDPEGQAGPSAVLRPADRLDLAVDAHGKRIRSRDEASELARRSAPTSPAAPAEALPALGDSEYELAAQLQQAEGAPPSNVGAPADDEPAKDADEPLAEVAAASAAGPELELDTEAKSDKKQERLEYAEQAKPSRRASKGKLKEGYGLGDLSEGNADDAFAAGGTAKQGGRGDEGRFAAPPPPTASAPAGAAAPKAPTTDGEAQERATAAASQPAELRSKQAAAPAKPSGPRTPTQVLADARTTHSASGCKAALPGYEQLITAFPNSREAGEAMLAAASCYRSLGQEALARDLLTRAAQRPATSARARAMLDPAPAAAPAAAEASERK